MRKKFLMVLLPVLGAAAVAQEQSTDEQLHTVTRPAATISQTEEEQPTTAGTADDAAFSVRDAGITGRIETTFLLNKYLSPFTINTTTRNGHVTLTGNVDDEIERDLAERLARSVDGVTEVTNQLVVGPEASGQSDAVLSQNPRAAQEELNKQAAQQPSAPEQPPAATPAPASTQQVEAQRPWRQRVDDATLRADVRSRLAYNTLLRGYNFDVEVDDGEVELEGAVPSEEARQQAEQLVRDIHGVVAVENDLRVDANLPANQPGLGPDTTTVEGTPLPAAPAQDDSTLGERAQQAQERLSQTADSVMAAMGDEWVEKRVESNLALNRNVSVMDLDVEVDNGICTIDGQVLTEPQKRVVEEVAKTTPGVQQVVNNVQVSDLQPQ